MSTHALSNGGRAIIMETLECYKKHKTLLFSDYEAAVEAIANIPAGVAIFDTDEKVLTINPEDKLFPNQFEELGLE